MQSVDHQGILNDIVTDSTRLIPKAHLNSVCNIHGGEDTCRYICLGAIGFVCVKNSKVQSSIDQLVEQNHFKSKGNNCDGITQE